MRNKKSFLILLLSLCAITSCNSNVPEDIGEMLINMTYTKAVKETTYVKYESKMKKYADNTFTGDTLGEKDISFTYTFSGKSDYAIEIVEAFYECTYSGNMITDGLTKTVEHIYFSSDNLTYYIDKTEIKDGEEVVSDPYDKGNGYYSSLKEEVFGDEDTHKNGLYYGQFLQSLSKNFSSFMKVEEDTLIYDPPRTGISEVTSHQSADMLYKVNSLGMLIYSNGYYYDELNLIYSYEEINVSYDK